MRKSLLFLVTEDWYFASHRLKLAISAKKKGYRVCLAARNNGYMKIIKKQGIECFPIDWNRGSFNACSFIKNIIEIKNIIKTIKPEIVHLVSIQTIITGCLSLLFYKKIGKVLAFTGLGTLFISNGLKEKSLRFMLKVILFYFSRTKDTLILVQNKDDKKLLLSKFFCRKTNIRIIRGSGVDTSYYSYAEEPVYPPFIVSFVGRFLKDKGIENLIEAFSIIRDKNLDIKLWLVGEPDYGNISSVTKEYLENAISVNKNIEWKGKVSNIKKIWKNSHIAVLPSKREGLPLSLLEAAACGKPIVASDVPGCREIAISGFNAILFDVDNIVQLAEAIIYLSLQHKLRKDFGINSRSLVEKDMSEKEVIQETIKVYENLLV